MAVWLGLTAAAATAAAGACAIDDEVVWVTGAGCTGGGCTTRGATDTSDDWDLNEGAYADPPDAQSDGGDMGASPDSGEDRDVPDPIYGCTPVGGGGSVETAQPIELGDLIGGLTACPLTSQWFRFAAAAGTRFSVEVATSGGAVSFLLYAGDEVGAVAAADADGEAAFGGMVNATGDFYLRFRSAEEGTVGYAFTVRVLEPR
jgi:hypothetical protein